MNPVSDGVYSGCFTVKLAEAGKCFEASQEITYHSNGLIHYSVGRCIFGYYFKKIVLKLDFLKHNMHFCYK